MVLFPLCCRSVLERGDYKGMLILARSYVDETLSTGSAFSCTPRFWLLGGNFHALFDGVRPISLDGRTCASSCETLVSISLGF